MTRRALFAAALAALFPGAALAAADALDGDLEGLTRRLLGESAQATPDDRVRVIAPGAAEDSFQVPVMVDATAVPNVKRIIVGVDYGPIPKILAYYPEQAKAKISFRFKIDQATPVRAFVETADGHWLVGGARIDAAGGGCTAPAVAYGADDWMERLGELRGRVWPDSGRVRAIIDHPMDTGLAEGIPVFILREATLSRPSGERLARLEMFEPVSEDPSFGFEFDPALVQGGVRVSARDNNGGAFGGLLKAMEPTR